ncbi:glycosyltransferase [Flavobacterium restrictum]|uniref:Glycosyltransferase family 4 protein n=1 Tax=Flavobacterium restrictum TaxID=2594428 RepID=A0A553DWA4_9FLAO|nr:glycosyltransferase [Flavobacterium restrictum]TRX37061.1 glycosyltransferase family 4 protein [Flavobacterium restrictum]
MIRVLHIIETIMSGGVERTRLSIAKLMDNSQFELKIICTHAVGSLPIEFAALGIEIIEIGDLKSVFDIKQHKKVMRIIDDFKPHIIHGAVFEGVTMAAISGFIKKVPIVILEETSDPQNRRWKGHLLLKLLSLSADKVIGVSPGVMEYLTNKLYLSKKKSFLLNNGVKIPKQTEQIEIEHLKRLHGIDTNHVVIGSVGRMLHDDHKRYSDLIKAFAILINKGLKVKLILVSGGRLIDTYQELVNKLQIQDHVVFTGYQNNPDKYYAVFDIFSLVSAYEAFGLVLAEAMLHKLPIVATKVGGMKYIVKDNETGFLVNKYDIQEIAIKLEELYFNENLRKSFGENGYARAINNYTEDIYVKNLFDLYKNLLIKKGLQHKF